MSNINDSIKWVALLQSLRHEHAQNQDQLALLQRNKVAEDIVMGWIGVELYQVPPGVMLQDVSITSRVDKISWLWQWMPMNRAMDHASICTAASTLVMINAVNWLISHGIIWPDGSVSEWAGTWRRANAQSGMANKLRPIHLAEKTKNEAALLRFQVEEIVEQNKKKRGAKP